MRTISLLAPLSALFAAALSADASPVAHHKMTRSLAATAAHKAKEIRQTQRAMEMDFEFGDKSETKDEFGAGGIGFGDMDMPGTTSDLMCSLVEMAISSDPEMQEQGISCDCSASNDETIDMTCSMAEKMCEVDPVSAQEFCIDSATVGFTMPLDLEGDADLNVCAHYSADKNPAEVAGKEVCVKLVMPMDLSDLTAADELVAFSSCEASVDGNKCSKCSICNDGLGIEVNCGYGLKTEGCTDFTGIAADSENVDGGLPVPSSVSVMRFASEPEGEADSSSAAGVGGAPIVAAGFGLAFIATFFA